MILGTGVDIVMISRIRDSIDHFGETFLERVFTDQEVEYCNRRKDPVPSLAARFAAKEAAIKAMTTNISVPLRDIEVVISDCGKPEIRPGEAMVRALDDAGIKRLHLSLSHEREYATAFIVAEG